MTDNTKQAERPPRRRLVGVSTKMYFDLPKTASYTEQVLALLATTLPKLAHPTDVFLIPDFLTILSCRERIHAQTLSQSPSSAGTQPLLWLGAQDTHHEDAGAFTGEVSARQLAQAGVRLVEIGHAERRRFFGETDAGVVLKAKAALRNGLTPLICVGEQAQEGGVENAVEECWAQVRGVFEDEKVLEDSQRRRKEEGEGEQGGMELVLAYEPVWAIGQPQPATPEYVVQVTKLLRQRCAAVAGYEGSVRILYGGSAGPGLYEKLQDGVDGLFLGRFAHDPEQFVQTVTEVAGGLK